MQLSLELLDRIRNDDDLLWKFVELFNTADASFKKLYNFSSNLLEICKIDEKHTQTLSELSQDYFLCLEKMKEFEKSI